jgi:hypothetical protein
VATALLTGSAVAAPPEGATVTVYPAAPFRNVIVPAPTVAVAESDRLVLELARPVTIASLIVKTVLAPKADDVAVRTGKVAVTRTVLDVPGNGLLEVVTAKVNVPVEAGALAWKSTCTVSPALRVQELSRSMVTKEALEAPPSLPDWRHEPPSISAISMGADPSAVEGATETQPELVPARDAETVKETSKPVDAFCLTPPGEALTLTTDEPMLYGLVVIPAGTGTAAKASPPASVAAIRTPAKTSSLLGHLADDK